MTLGKAVAVGGGLGMIAGLGLGISGRIAMRVIAMRAGFSPGASVGGTLEVIATGIFIGGVVGLVYGPVRRWLPPGVWIRGFLIGAALVIVFALYQPPAARSALSGTGHGALSLALFAICFLGYGWLLEWLLRRFRPRSAAESLAGPAG